MHFTHWKCAVRCRAQCPRINLKSLDSDQKNSKVSTTTRFHVYYIIACFTMNAKPHFNENRQCQLCEDSTD